MRTHMHNVTHTDEGPYFNTLIAMLDHERTGYKDAFKHTLVYICLLAKAWNVNRMGVVINHYLLSQSHYLLNSCTNHDGQ